MWVKCKECAAFNSVDERDTLKWTCGRCNRVNPKEKLTIREIEKEAKVK